MHSHFFFNCSSNDDSRDSINCRLSYVIAPVPRTELNVQFQSADISRYVYLPRERILSYQLRHQACRLHLFPYLRYPRYEIHGCGHEVFSKGTPRRPGGAERIGTHVVTHVVIDDVPVGIAGGTEGRFTRISGTTRAHQHTRIHTYTHAHRVWFSPPLLLLLFLLFLP